MKKGSHHSEEARQKISEAQWGRQHSLETRQKMSQAHKRENLSPETRQRLSEARRGKHHSPETRKKIGEAHKGEKSPNFGKRGSETNTWKGGRNKDPRGYIRIYAPDHPQARYGYVFEHRLVIENALNRYLGANEFVHHINGIKDDNRLENLRIVNHHKEQVCPRCGWSMDDLLVA